MGGASGGPPGGVPPGGVPPGGVPPGGIPSGGVPPGGAPPGGIPSGGMPLGGGPGNKKGVLEKGGPEAGGVPSGGESELVSNAGGAAAKMGLSAAGGISPACGRSRTVESTRSCGPPFLEASNAPGRRSPGERSPKSDSGSLSAAMIFSRLALLTASRPCPAARTNAPITKGVSRRARLRRALRRAAIRWNPAGPSTRRIRGLVRNKVPPKMFPTPSNALNTDVEHTDQCEHVAWMSPVWLLGILPAN